MSGLFTAGIRGIQGPPGIGMTLPGLINAEEIFEPEPPSMHPRDVPPFAQNVAFNAGNFTASGTMTWTVEAADQKTFDCIMLSANLMLLNIWIVTSTVGGVPDTELRIAIPYGRISDRLICVFVLVRDNVTFTDCRAQVTVGGTYIQLIRNDGNPFTISANETRVGLQMLVVVR